MELLTKTFTAPSGISYTIREQNGQDEEVLTNVGAANQYMNINNFIQSILMESSVNGRKHTTEEILSLPLLDRQCILLQSRIFSLGRIMEFSYKWPGSRSSIEYEQDLEEFLLDYAKRGEITEEELLEKPNAIPFYPGAGNEFQFTLASGKNIKFHILDGHSELYVMTMDQSKATRNMDILARGLELLVEGKWEKVSNFSLFSTKDMREIRRLVNAYDPQANLVTDIINPANGEKTEIAIMSLPDFFFPEEDV